VAIEVALQNNNTATDNTSESANRLLEIVNTLFAEMHPTQAGSFNATLDSSLDRELGLDSLAQMELLNRIEQAFGITLPEQMLAAADTVRDLLRAVLGAGGKKQVLFAKEAASIKLEEIEDIPLRAETLVDVLAWHVQNHPDRAHIRFYSDQDDGEVITYKKLWQEAEKIAGGLQHYGLHSGESVLIMLPTGAQYFFSFIGVLLAGGIPVPVYPPGRIKQIEEHLRRHAAIATNSLAKIMITMDEAKRFADIMHKQVINLEHVLSFADLSNKGTETAGQFIRPVVNPGDIAFLQYTSGSTGMPKGVVLSHANLLANIRAMGEKIRVSSDDVFVSWLPLYHDMGLIGAWLGSLHYACQLVIMAPLAFIAKPQRWLWAIHKYGGTLSAAPNFAYELCIRRLDDKEIKGLDLSSWRIAFNGAEAVNPNSMQRFIERFSDYGFKAESMMPVYGLAESSVGLSFHEPGSGPLIDRIKRNPFMDSGQAIPAAENDTNVLEFVSCGQPLPGHQIRIVDENDRELPERTEGHLQFLGPSTTSGYFKNPEKTSSLFHGEWLDSGDKAFIAAGEVYITGRTKDIIVRAGRNIYPVELEEAIGKVDGIREGNVAVFGSSSDKNSTEELIILAETRKKDEQALEGIRTSVNSIVTDLIGSPPDHVVLAPPNTVLKTSSGKIRRNASKEIFERNLIGKPQQAVWLQVARFWISGLRPRIRRSFQKMKAAIYAGWCWMLYGLASPLVWLLVVLLPVESWRWACMRYTLKILSGLTGMRVMVHGMDNLPDRKTPCIFVSNHASYLDSYVLTAVLDRPFSYIAKKELKMNIAIRMPLEKIGTLFVERFDQQKGLEDARFLEKKSSKGRSLFFFPEGTFMRMPGLLPFRMGAFQTAAATGLPIVPIAIRGSRSILRAGSWFPRQGIISLKIGTPISLPEKMTSEKGRWSGALQLRDQSRAWILSHCGEPDLEHERPILHPPPQ
jgi:1-acyl-sn-glycerol-3-phosphate acyltransferase